MKKPKIGLLAVTSGWFRDVGLQGGDSDTSRVVDGTARKMVDDLEAELDIVFPGVLFSMSEARKAARRIVSEGVDGFVVCPLMWCEDQIVRAALSLLSGYPLLLWTVPALPRLPSFMSFQEMIRGSGTVATMQLSGMLKREGVNYTSAVGRLDDPTTRREIVEWARSVSARSALRDTVVGVLPFRCDQMSTTYVDEFQLRHRYGVTLRYLELERFRERAESTEAKETEPFLEELRDRGEKVEVGEGDLIHGAKYALAMESILGENEIHVLAMNDVIDEMHSSFGIRPCLTNRRMSDSGTVVSMEADIAAALAMEILRRFTGERPFYVEPFGLDLERNRLLLGHAGYHDTANADPDAPVRIIPDVEYVNSDRYGGAVSYFKYRSGPVTAVNSVWDGKGLRWTLWEGLSLAGPPVLEGNSHLLCEPTIPVKHLVNGAVQAGVSQHWLIVGGQRAKTLARMCEVIDFSCCLLSEIA